jgi:hypothetical protein
MPILERVGKNFLSPRLIRLSAIPHRPDLYEADLDMPGVDPLLFMRLESSLCLLKQGGNAELSRFDAIHSIGRSLRVPWGIHGLPLQRGREGH